MPRDDGEVVRRLGLLPSSERRYKLVVAAGRLTESKGFDVLIEAMRELGEEIQCVIAGQGCQGAHEKALRAKAPANVAFVGELSRSELGSLLSLADVLAVPSRHEPFGLVALEAIASGTRAVAIADSTALGPFDSEERRLASELMARHSWGVICSRYEALLSEVVDDP
jgi:glycosyltransferase involved in cell wall biosynthesis